MGPRNASYRSGSTGSTLGLKSHPPLHVLQQIRGRDVQRIAQLEHHAHARTVPPKLEQGHLVAIHLGPQSQVRLGLSRLVRRLRSACPNVRSWFQSLAQNVELRPRVRNASCLQRCDLTSDSEVSSVTE